MAFLMNPNLKYLAFVLLIGVLFYVSCKKEYSCESCAKKNKPPIAIAGPDQVITLPTDSVSLDGNASSDPDGTISSFLWRKISGPASFNINNASSASPVVKNLIGGTYQFELKVTDKGGLSAKDTMQVIVDVVPTNHSPVANAGSDQTITLPVNSVTLDGSGSRDPDNNITSYGWMKISGPSSFSILNVNSPQTQVINLVQGLYKFELKVADAGGLFSKDTIEVNVIVITVLPPACNTGNRPLINAQLIPVGTLSHWRSDISIASANNKILFAGGNNFTDIGFVYSTVDIYDITTNSWSTSSLSQQKYGMGVAVLGSKIFFAGGFTGNNSGTATKRVDIYNTASNIWTIDSLSVARTPIGASVNGKVLFAGGDHWSAGAEGNRVDIFDINFNAWSTASLSFGGHITSATTVGNKVFFAGAH